MPRSSRQKIVIYALALIDESGWVHVEDIAHKCFVLDPNDSSWDRYRNFPDKEKTRNRLFDCQRKKNGTLVTSGGFDRKRFWKITDSGAEWLKKNKDEYDEHYGQTLNKQEKQELLKQYLAQPLFVHYLEHGNLDQVKEHQFASMLRCLPDWPADKKRKLFQSQMDDVKKLGDNKLIEFMERCRDKFLLRKKV